ncbi:hypothetical protein B0H17DRAFT_1148624 [Mycena rosella]|uniref:F-box domain-containing protein n=1 Tax=Mycena rosella TaxID=1033263 RepID=A0AAD7C9V8_MYCRO|nr:hypothetical protein B0H17DRAFT_1148624 [Mycena rosella]
MLHSFLRRLVCFPTGARDYDLLEAVDPAVWPAASLPPPAGPITDLPPELLHLIIEFVDPTMLATCSLVCRRWMVDAARKKMFARLSISLLNAHRFGRLFVPPALITFAPYVRGIELDHKIVRDFWVSDVLPQFIVGFPHLSTLTIFGLVPNVLPSAFQVITHLELNYVCTSHPDRLASFISTFPRLETLKLTQERGLYFNFGVLSEMCQPPPRLRGVDLDSPLLLHWIASANPKPLIESIRLEISHPEAMMAMDSIRALSPSLHALDLTLSDVEVGASFLAENHLDVIKKLRTLRIQADHSQAAQLLLKVLSEIDTSYLEEISLDFAIPYLDSPVLMFLPWDELDASLAALPSLRRLTVVKVLVSPHGWRSRINQRTVLLDAVNRMPLCRDFGVGVLTPDLESRPPSRAAGSPRDLPDLYGC